MNTTRRISRPLLGVLLVAVVALSARTARAEGTPRIFPLVLTGQLPPELTDAPTALTDALVALLEGQPTDRSLEEFGGKLRCDVETSMCLDAVARVLVASQLVYGTVAAAPGGKIKVKLVRFDSAKTGSALHQHTYTLTEKTPRRLGKQLARSAAQMFDRQPPEDAPVTKPGPPPNPVPPETVPPETIDTTEPEPIETIDTTEPDPAPEPAKSGGGVTGLTWGLIGGGVVIAATGGGFLFAARSLRDDIATAPRATPFDFRRLQELERAGKLRTQVGVGLAVGGGALLAIGVIRAIVQRNSGRSESLERTVSLVPVEGGAAIVFSGGLR